MLKEYEYKVENLECQISSLDRRIAEGRRKGSPCTDEREDRKVKRAVLQALVQCKYDIDSLLDYI